MTKKDILSDLINRVLTDKYELYDAHRSSKGNLQAYEFVLTIKKPMTKEEFNRLHDAKVSGVGLMTKKEILSELISRVLTGEYELWEVRRSNHYELQEYDFVIKKATHSETKVSEVELNKPVINKSVKINVENIGELEKLIVTAEKQSKQLKDTISKLDGFNLKIISKVNEKASELD